MNSKGYALTLDAIIAMMAFLIILVGFMSVEYQRPYEMEDRISHLHSTAQDAIDFLNKNGILEQVVFYWSENSNLANKTATHYLDQLLPENIGYRLEVEGHNISDNSRIGEDEAVIKTSAECQVSGYAINESVNESVSMAWLLYNHNSTLMHAGFNRSFKAAIGSKWTIEHDTLPEGTATKTVLVPSGYSGDKEQTYMKSSHNRPVTDDSIDDAVYRLLVKLDTDNDGSVNLIDGMEFDPNHMEIISPAIPVKSMHDTVKVRLILWMK